MHFALQRTRVYLRRPLNSLVVVFTLAIGLYLSSTIFAVVDGALFQGLPFDGPEDLVFLQTRLPAPESGTISTAPATLAGWRIAKSFQDMAAFEVGSRLTLIGSDRSERLRHAYVTTNFFRLLGVSMRLGPGFSASSPEDAPSQVVIAYSLWKTRFAGDESVIGRRIETSEGYREVVGVLDHDFTFPFYLTLFEPRIISGFEPDPEDHGHYLNVIGRLRPGASIESASREMALLSERLQSRNPEMAEGETVLLTPLHDLVTKDSYGKLAILFLAGVMVLMVAVTNVASVAYLSWERRERELALRSALGAGRVRLSLFLLSEGVVFGLVAGLVCLALLVVTFPTLIQYLPDRMQFVRAVEMDWRVCAFALVFGPIAGLLSGILPLSRFIFSSRHVNLRSTSSTASRSQLVRAGTAAAQVALVVVLLIGAGFATARLVEVFNADLGFATEDAVLAVVWLPRREYAEETLRMDLYERLLARVRGIPEIEAAGATETPLLIDASDISEVYVGGSGEPSSVQVHRITPGTVRALGLRVLQGSVPWTERPPKEGVALVNETAAKLFWPKDSAVGRTLRLEDTAEPLVVKAVLGDARLRNPSLAPGPEVYLLGDVTFSTALSVVVRSSSPRKRAVVSAFSAILKDLDPRIAVKFSTLDELVEQATAERRLSGLLFGLFSLSSLALAAVGCYGVTANAITERRRELGIRIALGANSRRILRLVLQTGLLPVLLGLLTGTVLSRWTIVFLSSRFGESEAPWALIYPAVFAIVVLATALAVALPARRALRVDPMEILRGE